LSAFETPLIIAFAIAMIAAAVYFIRGQRISLRKLRADLKVPSAQRRYIIKQSVRRQFGSCLLILLAGMMMGSLFIDYELLRTPLEEVPPADQEAAKQAFRFISIFWMTFLMILMAVMALAILDLWATMRHGVHERKQLLQENQEMLEAELEELRHRRAEMN
jgi:hypothetical protein